MKRILISGYHGFGNCGDEAILSAMVNNLKYVYPDLEIVALSKKPQETRRVYGITAINRINILHILYQLKGTTVLLSGGGSLLQDVTSTRSLIYYLSVIVMAKMFNKPVILYANGIGPIKKAFNKYLTKLVLNNVDMITLRDEESKQELRQIGVTKPEIAITADPVFTLECVNNRQIDRIFRFENIDCSRPLVGISIRKWKTDSDFEASIAGIADKIIEKFNYNVLFIPMHMPQDSKIINSVQKLMKNKSYAIKGKYSVQEYMGIIGRLHSLISMRLHTLIFAAVQKVPMFGLVYDPKVQNFLDMVGQPSIDNLDNIDENKIYDWLTYVKKHRISICGLLESRIIDLRKKAETNDNIVMKFLEKY